MLKTPWFEQVKDMVHNAVPFPRLTPSQQSGSESATGSSRFVIENKRDHLFPAGLKNYKLRVNTDTDGIIFHDHIKLL